MIPVELRRVSSGNWFAQWSDAKIRLVTIGSEDAPHPAHRRMLTDLVTRWPEVCDAIEKFVRALPPDARVRLQTEPGKDWAFAASDCGFDGRLFWGAVSVTDPDPKRAIVSFHTGLPDGYASYEVVLVDGTPIEVSAYTS